MDRITHVNNAVAACAICGAAFIPHGTRKKCCSDECSRKNKSNLKKNLATKYRDSGIALEWRIKREKRIMHSKEYLIKQARWMFVYSAIINTQQVLREIKNNAYVFVGCRVCGKTMTEKPNTIRKYCSSACREKAKVIPSLNSGAYRTRISRNISSRFCSYLRNPSNNSKVSILGYSYKELMEHLEKHFEDGMTWENYGRGGWNIDHCVPLAMHDFRTNPRKAIRSAYSLDNLRPRWETTQIAKIHGSRSVGNFDKGGRLVLCC